MCLAKGEGTTCNYPWGDVGGHAGVHSGCQIQQQDAFICGKNPAVGKWESWQLGMFQEKVREEGGDTGSITPRSYLWEN